MFKVIEHHGWLEVEKTDPSDPGEYPSDWHFIGTLEEFYNKLYDKGKDRFRIQLVADLSGRGSDASPRLFIDNEMRKKWEDIGFELMP